MNQNMQQISPSPRLHAEALRRMGRGPDSELVHMTPSEVDALNGLAQLIYNKPLPTNPETGLPEANLFKRLLPTVLAIGAGAFLGPAAASLFSGLGSGALAAGLGTGLASFGGHALGRALTGQEFDFAKSGLAGLGSGLTAGFGFTAPDAVAASSIDPGGMGMGAAEGAISTGSAMPFDPTLEVASAMPANNPLFDMAVPDLNAYGSTEAFRLPSEVANIGLPTTSTASTPLTETIANTVRTPTEAWDHLMKNKWSTIGVPLATAVLSREFDEEIEAPAEASRRVFNPKKLKATRERFFEEGEGLTKEEIEELVQSGLPEGRRQRFFGPTIFTEEEEVLKKGGLIGLQRGGNIAATISSLTGGMGSGILPFIAESIKKEEEEEKERSTTQGYRRPLFGQQQGIGLGGGQSIQAFQSGSVDDTMSALEDAAFSVISESDPATLEAALTDEGAFPAGSPVLGGNPALESGNLPGQVENAFAHLAFAEGNPLEGTPPVTNPSQGAQIFGGLTGLAVGAPLGLGATLATSFPSDYGTAQVETTNPITGEPMVVDNLMGKGLLETPFDVQHQAKTEMYQDLIPELLFQGYGKAVPKTALLPQRFPLYDQPRKSQQEQEQDQSQALSLAITLADMAKGGMDLGDQPEDPDPVASGFGYGNVGAVPSGFSTVSDPVGGSLTGQSDDTGPSSPTTGGPAFGDIGGHYSGATATPTSGELSAPPGGPFGDIGGFGFGFAPPGGPFGDIGGFGFGFGPGGGDDGEGDDGSGDAGEGGGPAGDKTGGLLKLIGNPLGDPYQEGGSLGQRALGSSPYFEGRVRGPGDGMSDNLPFMIAERQEGGHLQTQPAVLSPDEYVMPADVVSMLGNGSSTAGANQLDQFINNFRMDKYGRAKQPPEMRGGLRSLA